MRILGEAVLCLLAALALGQAAETDWKGQIRDACLLIQQGHFEDAAAMLRIVADQAEDSRARAAAFSNLGFAYTRLGRYAEAEQSFREATLVYRESGGDDNPRIAAPLNGLAVLYIEMRRYRKARSTLKKALAAARHEETGEELANVLINLGEVERAEWNLEDAETCYRRALALLESRGGRQHPSVPIVLLNLGALSLDRDHSAEAIRYLEQALGIWKVDSIQEHPNVASALAHLGRATAAEGRLHEAAATFRQALDIAESSLGGEHPKVAEILWEYSRVLRQMKRKPEAKECKHRAQAILEQNRRENLLHHTVDWSELQAGSRGSASRAR